MLKRIAQSFTLRILLLVVVTAALTFFIFQQDWFWVVLLTPVELLLFILTILFYRQYTRKIAFMFDAIENGDSAFQYATHKLQSSSDRMVTRSLNRVIQILSQAKTDIVQREKYYELILDCVNTGIIVIDENGYVIQTNNEALRLLGMSVFTHVKQLSRIDNQLEEIMGSIQPGEMRQATFSNERGSTTLSFRASEMKLKEKRVRIIAINDINRELDDQEIDAWNRLTRVMTHEIMNSITPITSLSDTLLVRYQDTGKEVREGLEVISKTGKGLISFVESYRKFTRIPTPVPSLFYISKLLERVITLVQSKSSQASIRISYEIKPEDLIVYADETLVSQVLINLINNAIQAIGDRPDGEIHIKSYSDPEEAVILEVSNNGPAIRPDEAKEIFVPFYTTKEGGSGIGLSISRQIMRLSGGSLTLKQTRQHEWTTFVLAFN